MERPKPPDPDCDTCEGSGWTRHPVTGEVVACHCNPDHIDASPIDAESEPPC